MSLESGDAAIRHLGGCDQRHKRPGLMLLDWRMPGRSGADVLAWARAQPHLSGLPILVLSGVARTEDRQRAAELGADGFIVKPTDLPGYHRLALEMEGLCNRLAVPAITVAPAPLPSPGATPTRWERSARALRAAMRPWSWTASSRDGVKGRDYVESQTDQLTADLVRLCRAQGVLPRDILQATPAGLARAADSPLARQRRTVIRGLARRGWDTQEMAEIFPLTPAEIRLLVRRRG